MTTRQVYRNDVKSVAMMDSLMTTRQVYTDDVKSVAMMDGQLDDDTAGV